jgi:tRNA(Ile)-lysidine synthase
MQQAFLQYLTGSCLCSSENAFLLAVSGGIDSVVMTYLFHSLGFNFAIAHCNFLLRGKESDGDQRFVEELAVRLNRPLFVKAFNTKSFARHHRISIQMAARDLRYDWFNELADQHKMDLIATGHNQNDVVETILLNYTRGCGIRGLSGISPRHGRIIRPLLFAPRETILNYASEHKLSWREDSSNNETKYHRNKIRHTIIPALETINPAFQKHALENAHRLEQTGKLLDYVISQIKQVACEVLSDRYLIAIEKLQEYPAVEVLLYELLKDFGVNPLSIDAIVRSFEAKPGRQFHTRTHVLTRDRKHLVITPKKEPVEDIARIEANTALIDYPIHLQFSMFEKTGGYLIPRANHVAAFDADKVTFPLTLRRWRTGDRFHPLGMKGTKKISDFLINLKVPLPDKQQVWILEAGNSIIWVVNHRLDDRFRVTDQTCKILLVEFSET